MQIAYSGNPNLIKLPVLDNDKKANDKQNNNIPVKDQDNFSLRIQLTPEPITKSQEIFFEIAQNLERIKQDTLKLASLNDNDRALLVNKIDFEDHLTFKAMMYDAGLSDIDSGEFLKIGEWEEDDIE